MGTVGRIAIVVSVGSLVGLFMACSSSSSSSSGGSGSGGNAANLGGSNVQCKNKSSSSNSALDPDDKACAECAASNCRTEVNNYLGSNPNAFEGPCGAGFNCLCNCNEGDANCTFGCFSQFTGNQACLSATQAANSCLQSKCGSVCKESKGSSGDGGIPGFDGSFSFDGAFPTGTAANATCADLKACCDAKIADPETKADCLEFASEGDLETCRKAYTALGCR